jgi:3-hydroxyacyl-CoA dehydrogenase
MGSGIACHFANIGVEVLLLDIVRELTEAETKKGLTLESTVVRNRLVNEHTALKSKPALFTLNSLLTASQLETLLMIWQIADVDWIIEVVVERLDIKKLVLNKLRNTVNQVL